MMNEEEKLRKKRSEKMKRKTILSLAGMLVAAICLAGCSEAGNSGKDSQQAVEESSEKKQEEEAKEETATGEKHAVESLKDRGLEVVGLLNEKLHSEAYTQLVASSAITESELFQELRQIDFSKVENVYKITFSKESLESLLKLFGEADIELEPMSDTIKESLQTQMIESFFTSLVAKKSGSMALAVQGTFSAELLFVDPEKDTNSIYLFSYQNAYPVAVSFTRSDDGAVKAKACIVMIKDFKAGTVDEVKNSLFFDFGDAFEALQDALGLDVEQVK